MIETEQRLTSRRAFLSFLAGSPLLASTELAGFLSSAAGQSLQDGGVGLSRLQKLAGRMSEVVASPNEAINVFDLEAVARANLPPAHFGYIATGVDDDATLRANREAFSDYYMRPRRLVDVTKIDMSTELFGVKWKTPIVLAPAGSQKAFHPDGEVAVAKAARTRGHLQLLSTVTTSSVEEVVEARGAPVWFQLYANAQWEVSQAMLRRAEAAGCPVVVLTVDNTASNNRETLQRYVKMDKRDCKVCHPLEPNARLRRKPMFDGVKLNVPSRGAALTWDLVRRLKGDTSMKVVIKGIVTREDATLCVENGVDGIIVSNHGGRTEASGRATLDSLPEVVEAVGGRIPVLIDSGFRRGMDVFKALALGADAVCIGRPYLWGLAAFGQQGVERVLDILRVELEIAMTLAGTRSVEEIDGARIGRA